MPWILVVSASCEARSALEAFVPTRVASVAAVDSSAVRASASSFSVFSASGAEFTTAATAVDAALSAYVFVARADVSAIP